MKIKLEPKFIKDYKFFKKKHYNLDEVEKVYTAIADNQPLPNKYKNHYLKGDKQGFQECHIAKDLLMIYEIKDDELILCRLGTHKDLLNK